MTKTQTDPPNDSRQAPSNPVWEKEQPFDSQQSPPPEPQPPAKKPQRKIPKPVKILGAIALLVGVGYGIYRVFFYQPEPPGLFLSGRIEGRQTDVSAKIGGKVEQVAVREGEMVQPGELLVKLDDSELRAQLQGAAARVNEAQERLERARQQIPVLQAQLHQANLTTQQATQESQGRVVEAENAMAVARAQLGEAQENLRLAAVRQRRTNFLYAQGAVSAQERDEANAALGVAQARVKATQQQIQSAQGRLTQAQSALDNPSIRAAAAQQIEQQIAQARTDVSVAQQQVRDAQAAQAQIQANLDYLTIESPLAGNVMTRSVDSGEVVAAGEPLVTIVNLNNLYLRGFVPEGEIGKVKLGQLGRVYLDSFPNRPLEATVSRIDPKASFTPENTYFKKDRVTQVFGVELTLDNSQNLAKPGMPADGRILVPETQQERSKNGLPLPWK